MPDPNLRQAIRDQLALPANKPLLKTDMTRLKGLDGRKRGIADLTGLEHATYLQWTNLGENEIRDISLLATLVHLEGLWIYVNPISNLLPLANLTKLKQLNLGICEISDIRPLANLTGLEHLWLHHNQIQDVTPLANLANLTELWLTGNRIVDIRPLANLTQLEILRIHDNPILDVSPLKHLSLSEFLFNEVCELDGLPTQARVNNRRFPSVSNRGMIYAIVHLCRLKSVSLLTIC